MLEKGLAASKETISADHAELAAYFDRLSATHEEQGLKKHAGRLAKRAQRIRELGPQKRSDSGDAVR